MEREEIENRIRSLLKEVKVYQSQGLLDEAKEQLGYVQSLIKDNGALLEDKALVDEVFTLDHDLKDEIERVKKASRAPEMSLKFQDIVMREFSFSDESESASIEGAIALVQFGQFERAQRELTPLLEKEEVRLIAAKNILRCHMALNSIDDAIDKYREWCAGDIFTEDELGKLHIFLSEILDKRGITKSILRSQDTGAPGIEETGLVMDAIHEGELPEIISIEITMENGPEDGEVFDFDVHSQSGDTVNLLVPAGDSVLMGIFSPGVILNEMRFYSRMSLFIGRGEVCSRSKIDGKTGDEDYLVGIRVL